MPSIRREGKSKVRARRTEKATKGQAKHAHRSSRPESARRVAPKVAPNPRVVKLPASVKPRGGAKPLAKAAATAAPRVATKAPVAARLAPAPTTLRAEKPTAAPKPVVTSKVALARKVAVAAKPAAVAKAAPATTTASVAPAKRERKPGRLRSQLAREYETLVPYLRLAQTHPPLSREDEYALSNRSRAGDEAARRLLVNHNVAFVLSMCRRFQGKGCRMDDLVQEGMIGLLKAVEHFDPAKGNRFSTYASWWIRAYVQKFQRDMRATVKPIIAQPGEEWHLLPRDFSLDAPVGDDDDTTFLDRLEETGPASDERYGRAEKSNDIAQALERVKKRLGGLGWDIIKQRLEEDDPRTLEDIGKDWGLSRERVRQVEKSTRQFLSRYLEPWAA